MPDFSNWSDLEKFIESKINNALEKEVSEQARKTMKEVVETEVYDKYDPSQYIRLHDGERMTPNGMEYGLQNDESIYTGLQDDGELMVRNVRRDPMYSYKDISSIIESGSGYTWETSRIYGMQPYPRPFHEITARRLEQEGLAKNALIKGLKRQGIEIK